MNGAATANHDTRTYPSALLLLLVVAALGPVDVLEGAETVSVLLAVLGAYAARMMAAPVSASAYVGDMSYRDKTRSERTVYSARVQIYTYMRRHRDGEHRRINHPEVRYKPHQ